MADRPHRRRASPGTRPSPTPQRAALRGSSTDFGADEVAELAAHEAVTRHDVKAVEYLLRDRLDGARASAARGAGALRLHERGHQQPRGRAHRAGPRCASVWLPALDARARPARRAGPARGRTRRCSPGPTASRRPRPRWARSSRCSCTASAASATACSPSRSSARPTVRAATSPRTSSPRRTIDWQALTRGFVDGLGLSWNPLTTQIESHDWQVELYGRIEHVGGVLHNLCTDVWLYIAEGYLHPGAAGRRDGQLDDAAQGEPDPVRERRGEPRARGGGARHPAAHPGHRRAGSGTSPTRRRSATSASGLGHGLVALDNLARGLGEIELDRDRLLADLDAQPGGAGRGDPDRGPGRDRRRPQRGARTPTSW